MEKLRCIELEGDLFGKQHSSLWEFVEKYISLNNPQTEFQDGRIQCHAEKNRSFDDLLLLCQNYYPETTIEELVNTFCSLSKTKTLSPEVWYCDTINKPVITHDHFDENRRRSRTKSLFTSFEYNTKGNSQWSKSELSSMIKE